MKKLTAHLRALPMLLFKSVVCVVATFALVSMVNSLFPSEGGSATATTVINATAAFCVYNLLFFYLFTRKALLARIAKTPAIYFRYRILPEAAALFAVLLLFCILLLVGGDGTHLLRDIALTVGVPVVGAAGFAAANRLLCGMVFDSIGK